MEYKKLSNGQKIPVIGLGTWGIGGDFEKDDSREKEEIHLIEEAIKLGLTHIDTAEIYGNGQTEKEIGMAIKNFDRERLFITTKVWKDNLHYDDVISALNNSLSRLQTNYVDLYLVHYPDDSTPIKETLGAMEYLADKEKIMAIGVSNFSVSQLKEARKHLKKYKIVANQIEYNLLRREAEKDLIPFCNGNNIMVIAHRPLATGELTHKGIGVLDNIAKKYNKTNAQIAIKWVISHKNMITMSKSTKINHLKQNMDIFGWELKPEDKEQLDRIRYPQ